MRRKIPSTQSLVCFEAAARHESYTRAAQELALTQSAVSRQITALEDFLGIALFRRTRHGVALTPAGADYARQIARQLDTMERDTLDAMARQGQGGSLQLAAVPTFATRWLIPRLPDFAAKHPDITVHIETRTRPFLFNDTPFDAAIYAGTAAQTANWAGTKSTVLIEEDVIPVCSPALLAGRKALSPAAIARMPLLQQSTRPEGWRQWFDAQGVDAPRAHSGPRYELFSMIAIAAAHGLGVALMPTLAIRNEIARGELVIACDRPLRGERSYYLVTPAVDDERPALTLFRVWLLAQASAPVSQPASARSPSRPVPPSRSA
ncbi:DNA-binding transcriptional regulator, LysR family [Variovorax sp. HW608]|uniref:LysR substrate-binding domain-containing protein n=1 Tax=Variovorax sp. HW608 TaxID=1034889 RepID=UPI00081FE384|nr:LysR substrate-binding domain-containing protein [Variovorax sp. HW608]SCK07259.1 DNA-binding transcriptional regulator, LysR family [Variovorax sp. HW608]